MYVERVDRGTVTLDWMPRGLLGPTSVHRTLSVTNKIYQGAFKHPTSKNSTKNLVIWIVMIRVENAYD